MEVPNEHARKVLSLFGKRGLIVDLIAKDAKQEFDEDYVHIWLPQEWDMKKALSSKHETAVHLGPKENTKQR